MAASPAVVGTEDIVDNAAGRRSGTHSVNRGVGTVAAGAISAFAAMIYW